MIDKALRFLFEVVYELLPKHQILNYSACGLVLWNSFNYLFNIQSHNSNKNRKRKKK